MNLYQPETWVCGNERAVIWNNSGNEFGQYAINPVGLEIRTPLSPLEESSVDIVDEVFKRNGVKTR